MSTLSRTTPPPPAHAHWGGVFAMNPGEVYLSDEEYKEMIEAIKANL